MSLLVRPSVSPQKNSRNLSQSYYKATQPLMHLSHGVQWTWLDMDVVCLFQRNDKAAYNIAKNSISEWIWF